MAGLIAKSDLENVTENLLTLANMFRDDGKYLIAGALYQRAITFLDCIKPSETRQALFLRILEEQSSLARKMSCGHVAWRA
jgi:hypothetical protein